MKSGLKQNKFIIEVKKLKLISRNRNIQNDNFNDFEIMDRFIKKHN